MPATPIVPRFIRLRDAPAYLGMDRHRFNAEVRPYIDEIPIGKQGIAFDSIDLNVWADQYKRCVSRPNLTDRGKLWAEKQVASIKEDNIGLLTSKSLDDEFEKVVAQLPIRKPKPSSLVVSKKRDKQKFLVSDQKGHLKKLQ